MVPDAPVGSTYCLVHLFASASPDPKGKHRNKSMNTKLILWLALVFSGAFVCLSQTPKAKIYETHSLKGQPSVAIYMHGFVDSSFDAYLVEGQSQKLLFSSLPALKSQFESVTNSITATNYAKRASGKNTGEKMYDVYWSTDLQRLALAFHGNFVAAYDCQTGQKIQIKDCRENQSQCTALGSVIKRFLAGEAITDAEVEDVRKRSYSGQNNRSTVVVGTKSTVELPIKFSGYKEFYTFVARQTFDGMEPADHLVLKLAADSATEIITVESKELPYVYLVTSHFYDGGIYDKIRGVQGNGTYFILRPLAEDFTALNTDRGFELIGIAEGNSCKLAYSDGKPRFVTHTHVSALESVQGIYEWNGKTLEQIK